MVEVQTLGKISCRRCTDSRLSQPFLIIYTRNGINCWSNFEWSDGLKIFQLQIYFWTLNLSANIIQFYLWSKIRISYRKYILLTSYEIFSSYFNILSVPISWPLVQFDKRGLNCFGCNISSSLFYILKRWWFKITCALQIILRVFRGWHIFLLFS